MFILIQLCMLACSGLFRKFFRYLFKSLQNFIYLSFQINLVSRQAQFDIVILLGAKGPQKGPQPSAEARRKDDVASELLGYRSSLARKSRIYEGPPALRRSQKEGRRSARTSRLQIQLSEKITHIRREVRRGRSKIYSRR